MNGFEVGDYLTIDSGKDLCNDYYNNTVWKVIKKYGNGYGKSIISIECIVVECIVGNKSFKIGYRISGFYSDNKYLRKIKLKATEDIINEWI